MHMFTILSILVLVWVLVFIVGILYLYQVDSKPYLSTFLDVFHKEIPSSVNPNELSLLLYRKIVPSTFIATILILIKKGIISIKREDNYILTYIKGSPVSVSQQFILTILFDIIGKSNTVTLSQIEAYSHTHSNATLFLIEYNLWRNAAIGDVRTHYYEPKKGFPFVKMYSIIGLILILLNLVFSIHSLPIYLLVVPIFFLHFYYHNIYRRTFTANTEYFKWLAYKHSLLEAKTLPEEDKDTIYIYSTILGCSEQVLETFKEEDTFITLLGVSVHKCIHRAVLNGDRRVRMPWKS